MTMLALPSCESEDVEDQNPTTTDTNTDDDTNSDSGDTADDVTLETIDITFFKHLKQAFDLVDQNEIWLGYDMSTQPQYYIYKDANGNPKRGYLVNPQDVPSSATKIVGDNASGLDLYRYDEQITAANTELANGNELYSFDFIVNTKKYYLQKYTDTEVTSNNELSVGVAIHEIFHVYQFNKWPFTENTIQDQNNYPLEQDLLALQILNLYVTGKMPTETNTDNIQKYLEMYVAIRSKEIETDTSTEQFVKNMANEQEKGEGTAFYVERITGSQIESAYVADFSDVGILDFIDGSANEVRNFFAFGIWYKSGGSVIHMLKSLNVANIETQIESGKTPFDIANEYTNLTQAQKAARLQEAKDEFNWNSIYTQAGQLSSL